MAVLYGLLTALGPALLLSGTLSLIWRRLSRSRAKPAPTESATLRHRHRRRAGLALGATAAGALLCTLALGVDHELTRARPLVVAGALMGLLVGVLAIAPFDEGDALGAAEEGWTSGAPDGGSDRDEKSSSRRARAAAAEAPPR